MRKRVIEAVVAGLMIAGIGGAVFAQDAAASIAARRAFMKGIGAASAAAATDPAAKAKLVDGLKAFKTQFPAGSNSSAGATRALPAIWANKADFDAKVDAAVAAVDSGGRIDCGGCHTPYRGPAAPAA